MSAEEGYYFKDQDGKMKRLDWPSEGDWTYGSSGYRYQPKGKYKGYKSWSDVSEDPYRPEKNPSLSRGSKIQELFLNHCRKNKVLVEVSYAPQETLQGYILGFDQEAIVLEVEHMQYLLYKTALQSVLPLDEEHTRILTDDPVVLAKSYKPFA